MKEHLPLLNEIKNNEKGDNHTRKEVIGNSGIRLPSVKKARLRIEKPDDCHFSWRLKKIGIRHIGHLLAKPFYSMSFPLTGSGWQQDFLNNVITFPFP